MRDLGFALNDKDFSDRILHLQLVHNLLDSDDSQNSKKKQKIVAFAKTDVASEETSNSSVKVKTLHINSAVLASCSPFFYKLFKNGMKESQERNVTLKIDRSVEGAFMDLLNYMYTNTLSASSAPDLLDVLMLADKFEVTSCMGYCTRLLDEMPMSLESAILYVEILSTELVDEEIHLLIVQAKSYLRQNYADIIM